MRLLFIITVFSLSIFPWKSYAASSATAEQATKVILEKVFDEAEKVVIEEYFGNKTIKKDKDKIKKTKSKKDKDKSGEMPPGLAKKEWLPPGLSKQLQKNGRLPPGIEKRDLPDDLVTLLPPVKKGTKRAIVGKDLVLLEEGTDIVLDVIKDVLDIE